MGDLIDIVIVIPTVVSAVVILRIGIIGFWGTAPIFIVLVFSVLGSFGASAFLGGLFSFSGIADEPKDSCGQKTQDLQWRV